MVGGDRFAESRGVMIDFGTLLNLNVECIVYDIAETKLECARSCALVRMNDYELCSLEPYHRSNLKSSMLTNAHLGLHRADLTRSAGQRMHPRLMTPQAPHSQSVRTQLNAEAVL